jgi:hypothetical protein
MNYGINAELKGLKHLQFAQKKSPCKIGAKKGVALEEISANKKKPNSLHWDNRKDTLRVSQEWARPHAFQRSGYKIVNTFERLSLEKKALLGCPAGTGLTREMFSQVQPDTQRPLQLWPKGTW